jgi:glutathione synthase/RimK-type ligase-like ATP-grasp enzyme
MVVNWGDYEWEETGQYAVINSAEAVGVARDKLASLERLGELAPASTTRPAEAVARFGPVFAGKGRTGQSGSGKAILQNPPGGPADRPLGNLSASAVSGYDYYQEYLPERTEYRALVLGGEVIALYKRVPEGVEPGQLRPDSFEYQPLPTIGQRQLEASQIAMERVGLDFGGVDLVEDTATGRLMVLEVNSAPGLGQESLERLYRAAHAQLHSPEAE